MVEELLFLIYNRGSEQKHANIGKKEKVSSRHTLSTIRSISFNSNLGTLAQSTLSVRRHHAKMRTLELIFILASISPVPGFRPLIPHNGLDRCTFARRCVFAFVHRRKLNADTTEPLTRLNLLDSRELYLIQHAMRIASVRSTDRRR